MRYIYPSLSIDCFECNPTKVDFMKLVNAVLKERHLKKFLWYIRLVRSFNKQPDCIDLDEAYNIFACQLIQESITIDSVTFKFHINATLANELAKQYNPVDVSMRSFVTRDEERGGTLYEPPDKTPTYEHRISSIPIVAIPHFQPQYPLWVVDGNHRITAKKGADFDTVSMVALPINDVWQLFATDFERLLWLFLTKYYT